MTGIPTQERQKQYPDLTQNAQLELEDRYLRKNDAGEPIETFDDLCARVAKCVAQAEYPDVRDAWAWRFYDLMRSLDFLPNSPTLMNAGREYPHGQLSACFVVGMDDSMKGIMKALRKQVLIHKSGGGTGFDFTPLRGKGSRVNSTNGIASGPISFMRLFDTATEVVQQGGMRRGANMGLLSVEHPDIEEWITCKDDGVSFVNFNLSVKVTDGWMDRVKDGDPDARALFRKIAEHAWRTGDPGIVFIDTVNLGNDGPRIEAMNPCGESPLLPDEACNLGSINLLNHLYEGVDGYLTWDIARLEHTARVATRFLSDVIDVNHYPLPKIAKAVQRTRKIGLGVMGWADALYRLRVPYASDAAVMMARTVGKSIKRAAAESSSTVSWKHGTPRNQTLTAIAPTGTISLIAGVSSGIEPNFSLSYSRTINTRTGKRTLEVVNREFHEAVGAGMSRGELSRVFQTAHDISPEWHIRHQAAWQESVDMAVSKTINLPHDATVEDVEDCFLLAHRMGCKGITVYRDGCRGGQPLVRTCVECG